MTTHAILETFLNKKIRIFTLSKGFTYRGILTNFDENFLSLENDKFGTTVLSVNDIREISLDGGQSE